MWLYLARLFEPGGTESFQKIGVTSYGASSRLSYGTTKVLDSGLSLRQKFQLSVVEKKKYVQNLPYEFEVLHEVYYRLEGDALVAEREFLRRMNPFQVTPFRKFDGWSECFSDEAASDSIIEDMNLDCASRNELAPNGLIYQLHRARIHDPDPIKRHLLILKKCS
jgi:hypothetical protein